MATTYNKTSLASKKTTSWSGLLAGTYTLWFKQMLKFVSSGMEVTGTLFIPLIWMFLFGVCMNTVLQGVQTGDSGSIGYTAYITPGVMLLVSLTAAVLGGSVLLSDRVNGLIKEYLVAPVPRLSILLGTILGSFTKAMLQGIVVLVLGVLLDSYLVFNIGTLVAGLAVIAIYTLGFIGIAMAFACKAKETEGYHSLILILNVPVLFMSNALYPLDKMPDFLRFMSYFNPTTYAVDAARYFFYNVTPEIGLAIDIPLLLAFMVAGIWYGYRLFKISAREDIDFEAVTVTDTATTNEDSAEDSGEDGEKTEAQPAATKA